MLPCLPPRRGRLPAGDPAGFLPAPEHAQQAVPEPCAAAPLGGREENQRDPRGPPQTDPDVGQLNHGGAHPAASGAAEEAEIEPSGGETGEKAAEDGGTAEAGVLSE